MKYALIVLFSILMIEMDAQEISSHRWENRIIIVIAKDFANKEFKAQIKELQGNSKGLEDRKLIIYNVLPDKYRMGLNEGEEWLQDPALYEQYKPEQGNFRVILIGLDGGIKLQETDPISSEKLFATIDGMPMRQAELRKKNNQ